MPIYLFLALVGALAYGIGSIFNKQAMTEGCGVLRVFAAMTWTTTALLVPFVFLTKTAAPWHQFHQPVLARRPVTRFGERTETLGRNLFHDWLPHFSRRCRPESSSRH